MVCFASQWIGIQSWVHHDSIHECAVCVLGPKQAGCALKKSSLYFHHRARRRCGFLFLLLGTLFGADPQQPSTLRASELRRVSRDWRCPSVSPDRIPSPVRGCFAAPFLPPQSEPSADVCCVVSRVAYAW